MAVHCDLLDGNSQTIKIIVQTTGYKTKGSKIQFNTVQTVIENGGNN